jgi:mRNA-degrading endonuclease RelE of RelBE toxin-antitoxin system
VASYKVEVKKSALKDLEKLDKHYISKIFQKIESLSENPRPVQTVTVFGIGHRKEVYRKV